MGHLTNVTADTEVSSGTLDKGSLLNIVLCTFLGSINTSDSN